MWLYFGLAAMFFLMGLAIHVFKWYFLIAGYNTMSKEQQAQVDTEALGRLMGLYSYTNGAVLLLSSILVAIGVQVSLTPALIFFAVSTVYIIIKAQTFNSKVNDKTGKIQAGAGKQAALPLVITVVTLVGVAVLMLYSSRPTTVSFQEEGLQIHGMYGLTYTWDDMDEVRLVETIPANMRRTNGSAIGPHLRGNFSSEEFGAKKLFVNRDNPPFIFLSNGEIVIFNLEDAQQTKDAYERILEQVNNL